MALASDPRISQPILFSGLTTFFSTLEPQSRITGLSLEHLSINYQRRRSAEKSIEDYILSEELIPQTKRLDKTHHTLGLISALSGFGKTRLLLELPSLHAEKHSHWRFIYMTYNSITIEQGSELRYPSELIFSWRLLYFYYSPNQTW